MKTAPMIGFADIRQDGLVAPLAGMRLAGAELQIGTDIPGRGDLGAAFPAHEFRQTPGELALRRAGERPEEQFGDGEAEHTVAQEFQALIALPTGLRSADMGQRLIEELGFFKAVAELLQKLVEIRLAAGHGFSGSARRGGSSGSSAAIPTDATGTRSRRSRRR